MSGQDVYDVKEGSPVSVAEDLGGGGVSEVERDVGSPHLQHGLHRQQGQPGEAEARQGWVCLTCGR